jgi:hypothetical protein
MQINKIEDIIIPTLPIGAPGWDIEILPIILGYAEYAGDELASPASQLDIENAEKSSAQPCRKTFGFSIRDSGTRA